MKTKSFFLLLINFVFILAALSQKQIVISVDDIPNTRLYAKNHFNSKLLQKLDSLQIPATIFINEGLLLNTKHKKLNQKLLEEWIGKDFTSLGNHSYSHFRYSETNTDVFFEDVLKGENRSKKLAKKYGKEIDFFRLPYNDLGIDSIQRVLLEDFLLNHNYTLAPFTIESSDWMFNYVYRYYKDSDNDDEALKVADLYVEKSIEYVKYFDSLSNESYNRSIPQIYLCHDNEINALCLDIFIDELKKMNYEIIKMEEALQDSMYQQTNYYQKKWGVSWFYRWIENSDERKTLMQNEPDIMEIYELYQSILAQEKKVIKPY